MMKPGRKPRGGVFSLDFKVKLPSISIDCFAPFGAIFGGRMKHHTKAGLLAVSVALALGLSACKKEEAPAAAGPQAAAPAAEESAVAKAQEATAAALAALSPDELRQRGNTALKEQRLYSPAGDNAMEYFLALRNKSKEAGKADVSAEMALTDLMPYAVNEAFQAASRADFTEAERLRALIEKADSQAPALESIAQAITDARTNISTREAAEAQRLADDARRQEEETRRQQLAQQQAAQQAQQAAARPSAPAPVVAAPAVPAPQPAATQPQPAASQPAAAAPPPRAASSNALVAISTPAPGYPPEAMRDGTSGEVVLSITVGTDGTVTSTSVVRASPRGVFERGVQNTVRRWRFQPIDSPQTIQRTFSFSP